VKEESVQGEAENSTVMERRARPPDPARLLRSGRLPRLTSAADAGTLLAKAVASAKEGDVSAVHFLYVRYADEVLSSVESIVRDRGEAEDVTQSVFTGLITAIGKYEQREGPFAAWLQRVARDAALERLEHRRDIACEKSA
jgi:DNA-directed RNA polymerase specialized sigma subunit